MKIGVDIDGVLALFEDAYAELLKQETGIVCPVHDKANWPPEWYWDRTAMRNAGYSPEKIKEVEGKIWGYIRNSSFWGTLHVMPGGPDALQRLAKYRNEGHDIYFITTRPGNLAKFWTEIWLARHGFGNFPTVIISADKGAVAKGIELDVFIDDKPENIMEVKAARPKTMTILVDRPYNRKWQKEILYEGGELVAAANITEALEMVFNPKIDEAKAA